MPEIPECLQRRYKALDDLIRELGAMSQCSRSECMDPGVRLMCSFWSILKDDPDCNLPEEVQHYFQTPSERSSAAFTRPTCLDLSPIQCFMAQAQESGAPCPKSDPPNCPQNGKADDSSGKAEDPSKGEHDPSKRQSKDMAIHPSLDASGSHGASAASAEGTKRPSRQEDTGCPTPPLNKVLTNLKQAASFDNSCEVKLKELLAAEKYLKTQIARLEAKEKEGVNLMREADEMWLGMENSYKERIAESLERQHGLMKQLQDIEKSAAKWRKNRRDLESQLESLNKCQLEMVEKINQKTNDLKSIDTEIAAYKNRIERTKNEAENIKKAIANKKKASGDRLAKIALEISTLEKEQREESKEKNNKEQTGRACVCEARADLQKICKVLLQRRLETEDLKSEKLELIEEINMLKDTCKKCKDRCKKKQDEILEEIKKTDIEIANFEMKCFKCHQCVDSMDPRTLCIDCPRCQAQRHCLVDGDVCEADTEEECVCVKVKKMFLNNVFENMSTVLEKKARTNAGRALGGEILKCLRKSRNAKLNERTKRMLQEFTLQTVKKNLNLTIVGGAVKTRCELDTDTYKQLMLCLKDVKATPPPKSSKGTDVKKDPCKRWGGSRECNCPKGPDKCICTRKAPPSVKDPATCPPEPPKDPGEQILCPHMDEGPCGPDCGAHDTFDMDRVGRDVSAFRPDACNPDACPFGKNMRAAQCVLGPESLKSPQKSKVSSKLLDYSTLGDQIVCKCGKVPVTPCSCLDKRTASRQHIIEEVIGEYHDVKPIDRVAIVYEDRLSNISERRTSEDDVRANDTNITLSANIISNKHKASSHSTNNDVELVWPKTYEDIGKGNKKDTDAKQLMSGIPNAFQKYPALGGIDSKSKPIKVNFKGQHSWKKPVTQNDIIQSLKFPEGDLCPILESKSNKSAMKKVKCLERDDICSPCKQVDTHTDGENISPFKVLLDKVLDQESTDDAENIEQFEESEKALINEDSLSDGKGINPFIVHSEPYKVDIDRDDLNSIVMQPDKLAKEIDDKVEGSNPFVVLYDPLEDKGTDPFVPFSKKSSFESKTLHSYDSETTDLPNNLVPGGWKFIAVQVSASGTLTMELDDILFEKLTEAGKLNQASFVYLNKTSSGRYFLDDDYVKEMSVAKLQIRLNSEGTLTLDVVDDVVFSSRPRNPTSTSSEMNTTTLKLIEVVRRNKSDTSLLPSYLWIENLYATEDEQYRIQSILDLKRKTSKKYEKNTHRTTESHETKMDLKAKLFKHFEETLYKEARHSKRLHVCNKKYDRSKSTDRYIKELTQSYDNNDNFLTLNVIAQNGVSTKLSAFIQKTLSENIALDVSDLDKIGEISNLTTDRPVLLHKSPSGNYNVFIGFQYDEDSKAPNAVLRRTKSNELLIVITEPVMKSLQSNGVTAVCNNKLYGVTLKGASDDVKIPPAVLRTSSSFNYEIVMDKEFEKKYTNSIKSVLDEKGECFVGLHRRNSNISIDIDENSKKNAVLVKTSSNTIKILVNGPIFESFAVNENKRQARNSNDFVEGLLHEIPSVRRNSRVQPTKIRLVENVKSSSESNLYKNTKMRDCLITSTSAKFQRTESGQYAAVLDKESKNCLLTHLHTHLAASPTSRVPIKISDSGEITIMFNYDDKDQSHFGSLKITPSGNLYVVVDENVLTDIKEKEKEHLLTNSVLQLGSEHMIGKIRNPENKSTVTCSAKYEDCACEPNECSCDKLQVSLQKVGLQLGKFRVGEQKCGYDVTLKGKQLCKEGNCDPATCKSVCCTRREDTDPDKPCSCNLKILDSFYFSESLYRYEDKCLSKEILEVNNLCNKVLNRSSTSSRSSLKSVSFGSSSSIGWICPHVSSMSSLRQIDDTD